MRHLVHPLDWETGSFSLLQESVRLVPKERAHEDPGHLREPEEKVLPRVPVPVDHFP